MASRSVLGNIPQVLTTNNHAEAQPTPTRSIGYISEKTSIQAPMLVLNAHGVRQILNLHIRSERSRFGQVTDEALRLNVACVRCGVTFTLQIDVFAESMCLLNPCD